MKLNKKVMLAIGGTLIAIGGAISVGKQHIERKERLNGTGKGIRKICHKKHAKKGVKIIGVYRHGKEQIQKKKDKDITISLAK